MSNKQPIILSVIILLVAVGIGAGFLLADKTPGKFDGFASCLKDKGAVFYGAFWCPHCQDQKKAFGNSAKLLKYVECSTPNRQSQYKICSDNNIQNYPTWIFADNTREIGKVSMETLSSKTGCLIDGTEEQNKVASSTSDVLPVAEAKDAQ